MASPSPFVVQDTFLGERLHAIKEHHILFQSPLLVSTTQTLSISNFLQILAGGLQSNTTAGTVTLTTPTAAAILAAIPAIQAGQQIVFSASSFATAVNANNLIILPGVGVSIFGGAANITIANQAVRQVVLTYQGSSLFVLS